MFMTTSLSCISFCDVQSLVLCSLTILDFLYLLTLSCVGIMLLITVGGIITGAMSDFLNARAISSVIMMYLAVPTVS